MSESPLRIIRQPQMSDARLVMGFSGWMDGGDVSTGTLGWLMHELGASRVAEIAPHEFFLHSFPGSMEIAAMFRPHVRVEDGLIRCFQFSSNELFCDESSNTLLFRGREPNMRWDRYADCLFEIIETMRVSEVYYVASVAGVVPHTRHSRLYCTVSDEQMKSQFDHFGVKYTHYEGPCSFSTYLMTQAAQRGIKMASFVAEIPAYVQDRNPKCIEVMVRKLSSILGLSLDFDELRTMSDEWERRLNHALKEKDDLLEYIQKLEEDYDNEVFDTQMDDLKDWLEQRGVRLD